MTCIYTQKNGDISYRLDFFFGGSGWDSVTRATCIETFGIRGLKWREEGESRFFFLSWCLFWPLTDEWRSWVVEFFHSPGAFLFHCLWWIYSVILVVFCASCCSERMGYLTLDISSSFLGWSVIELTFIEMIIDISISRLKTPEYLALVKFSYKRDEFKQLPV